MSVLFVAGSLLIVHGAPAGGALTPPHRAEESFVAPEMTSIGQAPGAKRTSHAKLGLTEARRSGAARLVSHAH